MESMGIPQARRLPLLLLDFEDRGGPPAPSLSNEQRGRLARLLGEDVGTNPRDWAELYDRVIATAPTPLSPELAAEANRVIAGLCVIASAARRGDGEWADCPFGQRGCGGFPGGGRAGYGEAGDRDIAEMIEDIGGGFGEAEIREMAKKCCDRCPAESAR